MTALNKLFATTTFRLSLLYFVLFGAAAALAIGYIYWNTNVLLARQLQQTVAAEIKGLSEQYAQGGLKRLAETVGERSLTPGDSLYLLTDRAGRRISGNLKSVSAELWNTVGPVEFIYRRPGAGGTEERVGFANVFRLSGGYRLIVGRDIEGRREFGRVIRSAFLWGIGFMALAGLGVGWMVSRNLLSRISAVSATSQTIMKGDLSQRVPITGSGDEIDRLSGNLNAMFDRIESLMNGLREVSDNIAHDLKTPLTRLRNRVEAALREKSGEPAYRGALEKTIEEADALIKTFSALLSIARLEAGEAGKNQRVIDLSSVARDVADLYEPAAEELGVQLVASGEAGVQVRADRQLIGQALANLIDNALKYARDGAGGGGGEAGAAERPGVVSVDVRRQNGYADVIVADNGPGGPAEDRGRVLKRFVRLEASRSEPGSGLGLSLVAAVARLHEGSLMLEDNEPGLKAVIRLPVDDGEAEGETANGAPPPD